MRRMTETRSLSLRGGRKGARSAVLVLHGGRERSHMPTSPWQLSYVRLFDMYFGLRKAAPQCAVYLLRYRFRGWNAEHGTPDPVSDALWALDRIGEDVPGGPVALLGHSMGGRTAFAVASHPSVVGVCGLAPWLPGNEPLPPQLRDDQRFVIAHGTLDRMTSPSQSLLYAARLRRAGAAAARFELPGARHAMLDHSALWRAFALRTTLGLLGETTMPAGVTHALAGAGQTGLATDLETFETAAT